MLRIKLTPLEKRHKRIRKKVIGTTERPRLSVHRSSLNLNVQAINDFDGKTLVSVSTLAPDFKSKVKTGGNVDSAKKFGAFVAGALKKKGIEKIVFDRGGFLYHGRIKAFADSLRENGIQF